MAVRVTDSYLAFRPHLTDQTRWRHGPRIHYSTWLNVQILCANTRHAQNHQVYFAHSYCDENTNDWSESLWKATPDSAGCFTSLKTGYITAYSVMDTMEFVSASFFISSIVILQGGAALVEKVRRKMQLTHTHTYTHPLTHTHSRTLWKPNKLQSVNSVEEKQKRQW